VQAWDFARAVRGYFARADGGFSYAPKRARYRPAEEAGDSNDYQNAQCDQYE
jgi:hypothetical protein